MAMPRLPEALPFGRWKRDRSRRETVRWVAVRVGPARDKQPEGSRQLPVVLDARCVVIRMERLERIEAGGTERLHPRVVDRLPRMRDGGEATRLVDDGDDVLRRGTLTGH